ncbi:MAG: TM0106 family RecB-like putative nuclease, partial [Nitrosarchaeum sp.]|nr:TM0106 family RecB-like putative nuclease [Nitrosarchaeum sp.]
YKFFQCPHWIWYDLYGDQSKKGSTPRLLDMIYRDGLKHEKEIVASRKFEEIDPESFKDLDEAFYATVELMKKGENIYHGVVMSEHWVGIPDMLESRPIEKGMKSAFGDHYYVVYDIKSGKELKDQYKFQLAFYSLILEKIQGVLPRRAYMINGNGEELSFELDEFLDYFHFTRENIERVLDGEKPAPFLKSGCKQSPWYSLCEEEAKSCGDVSLVYRLSQNDQRRLYEMGIKTVEDLANSDTDDIQTQCLDWPFDKILRFHNQANVLLSKEPLYIRKSKFSKVDTEIYFDVESDPTEGIDYLLGVLIKKGRKTEYKALWADDKEDEKRIWEEFLTLLEGIDEFVLYHYSSYERQIFDRFSNSYGVSAELANRFRECSIDIHRVVTESIILPLYFYGLKDVAQYIGFKWSSPDAGGAESVVWYNEWMETKDKEIKKRIIQYNEDDVRATLFIKEWIEDQKPKGPKDKEKLD